METRKGGNPEQENERRQWKLEQKTKRRQEKRERWRGKRSMQNKM